MLVWRGFGLLTTKEQAMLFWTKQAFYTSVFIFGMCVETRYFGSTTVMPWLLFVAVTTLTWAYYNNEEDPTRTMGNRLRDLRPVLGFAGAIFFSVGYFGLTPGVKVHESMAFGLGVAFFPILAVEACRLKEAQKKKDGGTTMFIFFFWPLFTSVIAIVTFYSKMFEATLVVSIVGQSIQWVLALVLDHGEYAKKHRSPFVRS